MYTKNRSVLRVFRLLQYTYALVPIIAGLDKWTNLLANWKEYIPESLIELLPGSEKVLLPIIAVVEVAAGVLVFIKPRIGAFVVMAWLICIALSLVFGAHYFDVAVRDMVMAVGAFTLGQLAGVVTGHKPRMYAFAD